MSVMGVNQLGYFDRVANSTKDIDFDDTKLIRSQQNFARSNTEHLCKVELLGWHDIKINKRIAHVRVTAVEISINTSIYPPSISSNIHCYEKVEAPAIMPQVNKTHLVSNG